LTPNVTDYSGLQIVYTQNLRPYDLGIMSLGDVAATGTTPEIPYLTPYKPPPSLQTSRKFPMNFLVPLNAHLDLLVTSPLLLL
jgi:hypothetical protein